MLSVDILLVDVAFDFFSLLWTFLKFISDTFAGSTFSLDISFQAQDFDVQAEVVRPSLTAMSTLNMIAAAWLQHEPRLEQKRSINQTELWHNAQKPV